MSGVNRESGFDTDSLLDLTAARASNCMVH